MGVKASQRIVVFGCYEDSELYLRNRVLVEALGELFEQVDCVRPVRPDEAHESNHGRLSSVGGLFGTAWRQLRNVFTLARQRSALREADAFFIPYPAYLDIWTLRLLTLGAPRRPIWVDAFLCLHDTVVNDRQMAAEGSWLSRAVAWLEGALLRRADRVLIDTPEQARRLIAQYDLSENKLLVVPVGLDEEHWPPLPRLPVESEFRLLFWGTFVPLHGVETLVAAARLLVERAPFVRWQLIGDGQAADAVQKMLDGSSLATVHWRRELVPQAELRSAIAQCHCVLGVFGSSDKAANVVPYKVHQALACDRPLITRIGPAMTGALGEHPAAVLVPPSDPAALAAAIEALAATLRDHELPPTRPLYDAQFSRRVIRARLANLQADLL